MAVAVGYNGTVTSWAHASGAISNTAVLALMTYNEFELTMVAAELDTSKFRAVGATGPLPGVYECMNGIKSWDGTIRGQNIVPVPGHIGLVAIPAAGSHLFYDYNPFAWDFNLRFKELDITAQPQASVGWMDFAPGQASVDGSMSFWMDTAHAPSIPNLYSATVTPTFTLSTGNTLACAANINSVRTGARVDDRIPVTLGYKATGDITVVSAGANILPTGAAVGPASIETTSLVLTAYEGSGTDVVFTGNAFIRAMRVACQVDQKTTVDIEFRGTGAAPQPQ